MDFNPNYDYFMGAREEAGEFPVLDSDGKETGEKKAYHYFLLSLLTSDVTVTDNTVSSCGFECLGIEKNGYSKGDPIYKDWRKIKAENIPSIFGFDVPNAEALKDYVFKPCQILFNKKGNISKIIFVDDKKGGK